MPVGEAVGVGLSVGEAVGVGLPVGETVGVGLGDTKLPERSTAVGEQAVREKTVAVIPLARIAVGIGRRPKVFANVASLRPAVPKELSAIMAAAKLLSRDCTEETRVGTSMLMPSGPAHSKEIVGIEEGTDGLEAESDTIRALDMPVTLTIRASASARTAS